MVAKFLDLNKPWSCKYDKKKWHVWLSCAWLHSGTRRWPIRFYHRLTANDRLCQERLMKSRNLATVVTWCHKSPPYSFLCVLYTIHAYNTSNVHQPFFRIEHHPNGDQTQFSPNDIHRSSRAKSMRINKMITRKKSLVFYQILPTNSSRKCMEISLENLYVDIRA